ncbi:MAG: CDP-alcohol phosphatidyltransferase family protein [Anaerolineales bacterium]|nr:MAG: CDP-alcohol phosphatidyltransferase family protein [Anaerolineales bacterium]
MTERLRIIFKWFLDPVGAFLNRLGLTPNTMTILGLVGNTIGAFMLSRGEMMYGGIIILLMGPVDALDGTMARLRGESGEFGAFVDSVTDRYSELVILGGLLFYYLEQGAWLPALLAYIAAAGSVLVSYTRARAQSIGIDTKVGVLTRLERYIVLAPALVFNIPLVALWIMAVLANVTAIQRIVDVRNKAHKQ